MLNKPSVVSTSSSTRSRNSSWTVNISLEDNAVLVALLIFENLISYARASIDFMYAVGIPHFLIDMSHETVENHVNMYKLYATLLSVGIAWMVDSYVGKYPMILTCLLASSIECICLAFFSSPPDLRDLDQQNKMFNTCLICSIFYWLIEPIRIMFICEQFPLPMYKDLVRRGIMMLLLSRYTAHLVALILANMFRTNKTFFIINMSMSAVFIIIYVLFLCVMNKHLVKNRVSLFSVEQLLACFYYKIIRGLHLTKEKLTPRFNVITIASARRVLAIWSVLLPTVAYFCVKSICESISKAQLEVMKSYAMVLLYHVSLSLSNIIVLLVFELFVRPRMVLKTDLFRTPLQCIAAGLIALALALLCCSITQTLTTLDLDPLPTRGIAAARIYNGLNEDLFFRSAEMNEMRASERYNYIKIAPLAKLDALGLIIVNSSASNSRSVTFRNDEIGIYEDRQIEIVDSKAITYIFTYYGLVAVEGFDPIPSEDSFVFKSRDYVNPKVSVACAMDVCVGFIDFRSFRADTIRYNVPKFGKRLTIELRPGSYKFDVILFDKVESTINVTINEKEIYFLLLLVDTTGIPQAKAYPIHKSISLDVWPLLPTIMFWSISIVLTELSLYLFFYLESPPYLRSFVICTVYTLQVPGFLVIYYSTTSLFSSYTAMYFFSLVGIVLIFVVIFIFCALRYTYNPWARPSAYSIGSHTGSINK